MRIVVLTNKKFKIIDRLKKWETVSALASEFNIGKSTVTDIITSKLTVMP